MHLKLFSVCALFFIVAIVGSGGGVVSAWPQGMTVWHRQNAVVDDAGHQIIGPQRAVRSSPPIPPHGQDPRIVMDEQSWAAPSYGYSGLADHPGAAAAEYASEPVYGMPNEPLAETFHPGFGVRDPYAFGRFNLLEFGNHGFNPSMVKRGELPRLAKLRTQAARGFGRK